MSEVNEAAVKLAQDVLDRLPMTVEPTHNLAYLEFIDDAVYQGLGPTVNDLHLKACEVCAQGAFVVAYLLDQDPETRITDSWDDLSEPVRKMLGRETWSVIEQVYEGWNYGEWNRRYPDPRRRLRAIAHNIVRNSGRFDPDDFYKPEVKA